MRPTTSLAIKFRKLKLTTKDVNKGFYKGNRTGSMGRHTRFGGYKIEWEKVRTYPVPHLEECTVRLLSLSLLPLSGSLGSWSLAEMTRGKEREEREG